MLAKPVSRPAFVLSKFAAAVPGVLLGAVAIPGVVARLVLVQAEKKGDTEFTAGQVFELTGGTIWDRDEFTTLPPLSRHLGTLALISTVLLLIVAVMILLGTVVEARAAIFLAGLAVPIGLLIYSILGQEQIIEITPALGVRLAARVDRRQPGARAGPDRRHRVVDRVAARRVHRMVLAMGAVT